MKLTSKFSFFAVLVLLANHNSYGGAIHGVMVSGKQIKNNNQITTYWQAPESNQYKLWLKVPADNTDNEASYFIYPQGIPKKTQDCLSNDSRYPCFMINLNHASHKE